VEHKGELGYAWLCFRVFFFSFVRLSVGYVVARSYPTGIRHIWPSDKPRHNVKKLKSTFAGFRLRGDDYRVPSLREGCRQAVPNRDLG
jgi:hypothetical protein